MRKANYIMIRIVCMIPLSEKHTIYTHLYVDIYTYTKTLQNVCVCVYFSAEEKGLHKGHLYL